MTQSFPETKMHHAAQCFVKFKIKADARIRTADLLITSELLYH
jgi:hypothetical protein